MGVGFLLARVRNEDGKGDALIDEAVAVRDLRGIASVFCLLLGVLYSTSEPEGRFLPVECSRCEGVTGFAQISSGFVSDG